jgi:hypothetical protein
MEERCVLWGVVLKGLCFVVSSCEGMGKGVADEVMEASLSPLRLLTISGSKSGGHGHGHGGSHGHSHGAEAEVVEDHPNAAPVMSAGSAEMAPVSAADADAHPAPLHTEAAPIEAMPALPTEQPNEAAPKN